MYRNIPIKGAPYGLRKSKATKNGLNCHNFLNICPIFNPKPPLESLEPQHWSRAIRHDLAIAPAPSIGILRYHQRNTVNELYFTCDLILRISRFWQIRKIKLHAKYCLLSSFRDILNLANRTIVKEATGIFMKQVFFFFCQERVSRYQNAKGCGTLSIVTVPISK